MMDVMYITYVWSYTLVLLIVSLGLWTDKVYIKIVSAIKFN